MKNTITRHSIRIKYNASERKYTAETVINEVPTPRLKYYEVKRKYVQNEVWPDGKGKVIEHEYTELISIETNPINPKRGTKAWKEKRRA